MAADTSEETVDDAAVVSEETIDDAAAAVISGTFDFAGECGLFLHLND